MKCLYLVILVLFSASCTNKDNSDVLYDTWQVMSIYGIDDLDTSKTEFVIEQDGATAMTVGCNRMRTNARIDKSSISFGNTLSTLMACPEPLGATEKALSDALASTVKYSFDASSQVLSLLNDKEVIVLTLKRAN